MQIRTVFVVFPVCILICVDITYYSLEVWFGGSAHSWPYHLTNETDHGFSLPVMNTPHAITTSALVQTLY